MALRRVEEEQGRTLQVQDPTEVADRAAMTRPRREHNAHGLLVGETDHWGGDQHG